VKKLRLYNLIICFIFIFQFVNSQQWVKDTTGIFQMSGGASQVNLLNIIDQQLYVGGGFLATGGQTNNSIAIWDGSTWLSLDGGMPTGGIYEIKKFENELFLGGTFWDAGGEPNTYCLAAWNGTSWHSVGTGVDGYVHAFEIYDNKLFIGGGFANAGSCSM